MAAYHLAVASTVNALSKDVCGLEIPWIKAELKDIVTKLISLQVYNKDPQRMKQVYKRAKELFLNRYPAYAQTSAPRQTDCVLSRKI